MDRILRADLIVIALLIAVGTSMGYSKWRDHQAEIQAREAARLAKIDTDRIQKAQRERSALEMESARRQREIEAALPMQGGRETEAFLLCQNHIRNRLKSPSTADFPLFEKIINHQGNERYWVHSYVDAKNSFGAEIRTKFWCTLQYTGPRTRGADALDPGLWRLVELHTNP